MGIFDYGAGVRRGLRFVGRQFGNLFMAGSVDRNYHGKRVRGSLVTLSITVA